MILVASYLLVSGIYFWREKGQPFDPVAVSALALGAGYIAIYLLVGSTPQSGGRAESMLTAVSVLSLGAVLFPELNRQHPEAVTRGLGFAGLIFMFVLVCVFRIWVW